MMDRSETVAMTAAHIAVSIVAGCRLMNVDPADAFTSGRGCRKARVIAAAGCMARLGWSRLPTARVFHLDPVKLAPSSLSQLKVTTEDLLVVAEALQDHGLTGGDGAEGRFQSPWDPASAPRAGRKPKAESVDAVRPVPRPEAARAAEAPLRFQAPKPGPRKPSAPRRIAVAPEPPRQALRARSAVEVRPITADRLTYIRRFLDSGAWRIEEVADLFDTHPDAIADAIAGPMGVAA